MFVGVSVRYVSTIDQRERRGQQRKKTHRWVCPCLFFLLLLRNRTEVMDYQLARDYALMFVRVRQYVHMQNAGGD